MTNDSQLLFRAAYKSISRLQRAYLARLHRHTHEVQDAEAKWKSTKAADRLRHPDLQAAYEMKRTKLKMCRQAYDYLSRLEKTFRFAADRATAPRVHVAQDELHKCLLGVLRYPALFPADFPADLSFKDWPIVLWREVEPRFAGNLDFSGVPLHDESKERHAAAVLKKYLDAWQRLPEVDGYVKPTFDVWVGHQLDKLTN